MSEISIKNIINSKCFQIAKNELIKLFIVMLLLFAIAGSVLKWQIYGYLFVNLIFLAVMAIMSFKKRDFNILLSGNIISKQYKYKWDKFFWVLYWPIYFGIFILAGLDVARHGCARISNSLFFVLGYLVYVISYSFVLWAMWTNKHFYGTAHIQKEQKLIKTGPYRIIRHPGYMGAIFILISLAVMLGSFWALIPAGIGVLLLIIRTELEERTLRANLAGYIGYAQKIKYRLMPGIW